MFDCDDGNLLNGDGCNSECEIEDGFECHKQAGGPDVCRDIIPPEVSIEVLRQNKIEVHFNEKVFPCCGSKF